VNSSVCIDNMYKILNIPIFSTTAPPFKSMASSSGEDCLQVAYTDAPLADNCRTSSRPMPLLAPVTKQILAVKLIMKVNVMERYNMYTKKSEY
jgi:hypothetical protein